MDRLELIVRIVLFACIIVLAALTLIAQAPAVRIACGIMTILACIRYATFKGGLQ